MFLQKKNSPGFEGSVPASRSVNQNVPVSHSVSQDSPTQRRSEARCRPGQANKVPPFTYLKFAYNNLKCIKINVNSVNTCTGPSLISGNHLDKIGEIGLKPALVEKRWLATFIMICRLGLVQGRAEVL